MTIRKLVYSICALLLALGYSMSVRTDEYGSHYFVAPHGDDRTGNGSIARPWRTIAHACDHVHKPGSTIVLLDGQYFEMRGCRLGTGVNLIGQGRERTLVKAIGGEALINLLSPSSVRGDQEVGDFAIDGMFKRLGIGVQVQLRDNVTIRDLEITNVRKAAIQVAGTNGRADGGPLQWIRGIKILDNVMSRCTSDFDKWSGGCIQLGHLDGGVISGNKIHEDEGGGIKQVGGGWFRGTVITNNDVVVPPQDRLWGSDITIEVWNVTDGVELSHNRTNGWISVVLGEKTNAKPSIHIIGNSIRVNDKAYPKEGLELTGVSGALVRANIIYGAAFGIAFWGDHQSNDNLIHNNYVIGSNKGEGVRIHRANNTRIVNNTFYGLDKALCFVTTKGTIDNTLFANNLVLNVQYGIIPIVQYGLIQNATIKRNIFYGVEHLFQSWGKQGTEVMMENNQERQPEVVVLTGDTTNPIRPASAHSIVIDAGEDVGVEYCGANPDVGAYELC